jgi:signal transduction histidine kinase
MDNPSDPRIQIYQSFVARLIESRSTELLNPLIEDDLGCLGEMLNALAEKLEREQQFQARLDKILHSLNVGLLLDEVLEVVYRDFSSLIPYDRIGLALLEDYGETVRARWSKSDYAGERITKGYSASLKGSSLQKIIDSGEPRVINDLQEYLDYHPHSLSTRLIIQEGIRSSLTCPLIANGFPVGFLFFSSRQPYAYAEQHVAAFQRLADQVAVVVDRARLFSELTEKNEAVQKQNIELQRLNELKNTFLGVAAHDLRSPLGYLLTTSELLESSYPTLPPESAKVLIEGMGKQAQHMLVLLDDMLDLATIEAGKLSLHPEEISLGVLVGSVARSQEKDAAQKGIELIVETVPLAKVKADGNRIQQVTENLVSNAIKFSPPGSTIHLRVRQNGEEWMVEVIDQGPGILAHERGQLFMPFSRLSAQPTAGEKSTGLGLAIARMLVEAHGGCIGVETPPQGGSAFWFTLPEDPLPQLVGGELYAQLV